jgi:serine/threonine-protein kinase/endoribonuclease IRE1
MLVSDFGLAKRLEHGQSSFAPTGNYAAGSAGWRAPECLTGEVKLNEGYTNMSSSSSSSANLDDIVTGEGIRQRARLTKAVDLFALGCLYFWVLMGGEHPYGEAYDRESNIVKGEAVNINRLEILGEEGWEARQLIDQLLNEDPKMRCVEPVGFALLTSRPTTSECLQHPFFWTPAKRLAFLCDASDRML